MANRSIRDLFIRFLGDEKDLLRSLGRVKQESTATAKGFQGLEDRATRLQKAFKGFVGGAIIGAIAGVTKALGDMAQAAAEDAKSQETLHDAIRRNTDASEAQINSLDKWIDRMQLATLVADTDLRQAIQSLVAAGTDLDEAQRIVAISADVAAARGKDFTSVIEGMIKAQNGQVTGLSRLGVATKDASGETLTFDEILTNLAETMGGAAADAASTLEGGMERARIAMEEAREEAGKNVTGPWSKLGDLWSVLNELLLTGQAELSTLNEEFNDLIREGVDPFADKTDSATRILLGMLDVTSVSSDTFATLRAMLGFTAEDTAALRDRLREMGTELGFTAEQVDSLVLALARDEIEAYHNELDAGRHRRREFAEDMGDIAGETEEATDQLKDLEDAVKALFNPIRQIRNAEEDWEDAARRQAQALSEGTGASEEATEAGLDLAEAYVDMNIAAGRLDSAGVLAFLDGITGQAGIALSVIDSLKGSLDGLANLSPINIPITITATTTSTSSGSGGSQTSTIGGTIRGLVEN